VTSVVGWYIFHDAKYPEPACKRCGEPRQGLMWGPCPGTPAEQQERALKAAQRNARRKKRNAA
jgi:hypothetical protein